MQNKNPLLLLSFLWTLLVFGCGLPADPLKYMQAVEGDEALNQVFENDEFVVSVHYRPQQYMVFREMLKQGMPMDTLKDNSERLLKESSLFGNGLYFEVRFSLKSRENIVLHGINSQAAYAQRIDYLNQGIYKDFYLLLSDYKKVRASGHVYQNTFGASTSCDMVVVFPIETLKGTQSFDLIYEDRVFGLKKERLIFAFDVRSLKKW